MTRPPPPALSLETVTGVPAKRRRIVSTHSEPLLQMPCLGRPFELGILYDYRNDSFVPGQTLWSKNVIQMNAKLDKCETSRYEISTDDSFEKKATSFQMEPSIKLSFLSNLVSVKGSAKYLEDRKVSHRQVRVALWYHCDTFVEKLSLDHLKLCEIPCTDDIEHNTVTHVVTDVQYGFDAIFVFDRILKSTEDYETVQQFLSDALTQIMKCNDEEQVSVLINDDEQKELNKFSCTFHGDFPLLNPPTTFDEAISVYRRLPTLLRKALRGIYGVPKVVNLHPIGDILSSAPRYEVLSSYSSKEILVLLETFFIFDVTASDLINGNISRHLPGIQQQIKKFQGLVSSFLTKIQQKLKTSLPKVRSGEAKQSLIMGYISSIKGSPFDIAKLQLWLDAKKQEALRLEKYLHSLKNLDFISQEKELEQFMKQSSTKCILALSFGPIASNSHPYLDELEEFLNDPGIANEWEENFKEHWFHSDCIATCFQKQIDIFSQFAFVNRQNKDVKCVVIVSPGRKNAISTPGEVFLYKAGSRKSFQPLSRPGPPSMVQNSEYEIEITWQAPAQGSKGIQMYSIAYQCVDDVNKSHWTHLSSESQNTHYRITQLQPKTGYVFKVAAVCEAGRSEYSFESPPITTKVLPSLAESFLEQSHLLTMASHGFPAWYLLPLVETYDNPQMKLRKYAIGEAHPEVFKTKVILVVGATGSGKTTLVNGMINYLFGTRMEDPFRLKLIKEDLQKNQAHSQTQYITAYTIYWQPGSRIDYNLTIVDTPGYGDTRGIAQDELVTTQIKEFFEMQDGDAIDQIDAVGFVAQASAVRLTDTQKYVFDAILSIFGRNISSNIFMMLTFADGRPPPAMDAIKEHELPHRAYFKFNNSVFTQESSETKPISEDHIKANISANETFDALFWQLAEESFSKFFQEFSCVETQSLKLTKEVLEERQHLEVTIENFHRRINSGVNQLIKMRQEVLMMEQFEAEKMANKQFTRRVQVPKSRRVYFLEPNRYVTNCLHCNVTCHPRCRILDDGKKFNCSAMKRPGDVHTTCNMCNNYCVWEKHVNRNYYFEEYMQEEIVTIEELKRKYDKADQTLSERDNILSGLFDTYTREQMLVIEDIETVRKSLQRLDEIAMKRNPMNTVAYIDVIIKSTKHEGKPGWEQRLPQLENARKRAEIIQQMEKDGKTYDPFCAFREEIKRVASSSKRNITQKIKFFFGI